MKVKKGVMRNIFPKETKEIYRILPSGKKFSGIPADTCWLFPAATGKINGYTDLPREGCLHLIAIQLGDSPILPLTRKNMEAMIGPVTNPKLIELLDKGNLSEAVRQYNRDFNSDSNPAHSRN